MAIKSLLRCWHLVKCAPLRRLFSRLNFMRRTHAANPDKRGKQIEQLTNQLREGLSYQGYEVTPNVSNLIVI